MNQGLGAVKRCYPQFLNTLFCVLDHGLAFDRLHQDMQVVVESGVLAPQVDDGAASVHHGGVIATAKSFSDFGQAVRGKLTGQPHGYLARPGDGTGAFLGVHIGDFDFIEVRHGFLHQFKGYLSVGGPNDVA